MALERLPDPTTPVVGPGFADATLTSITATMSEETNGGSIQTVQEANQVWSIAINYPDLLPDEYNTLYQFMLKKKGKHLPFEVVLPRTTNPKLGVLNNVTEGYISAGQSGNTLVIDNWSFVLASSSNRSLSVGDFLKLGSSDKVYTVTSVDYNAPQLTIGVYPNIITPTVNRLDGNNAVIMQTDGVTPKGDYLITSDVGFKVKNLSDELPFRFTTSGYIPGVKLNLRETI